MSVIQKRYLGISGFYSSFLCFMVGLSKTLTDDIVDADILQELLKPAAAHLQNECYRKRSCVSIISAVSVN